MTRVCGCGHDVLVHYLTPKGVRSWCTTWSGIDGDGDSRCDCTQYEEADDAPR